MKGPLTTFGLSKVLTVASNGIWRSSGTAYQARITAKDRWGPKR